MASSDQTREVCTSSQSLGLDSFQGTSFTIPKSNFSSCCGPRHSPALCGHSVSAPAVQKLIFYFFGRNCLGDAHLAQLRGKRRKLKTPNKPNGVVVGGEGDRPRGEYSPSFSFLFVAFRILEIGFDSCSFQRPYSICEIPGLQTLLAGYCYSVLKALCERLLSPSLTDNLPLTLEPAGGRRDLTPESCLLTSIQNGPRNSFRVL